MKKKHMLLPLVGIAVLSSCDVHVDYGPEISDKTEIQEIETAISAKMNEVKNYEVVVKYDYSDKNVGQDDRVAAVDTVYRVDQNGNQYFSASYDDKGAKGKFYGYDVTDRNYGEVFYFEVQDSDGSRGGALLPSQLKPTQSEADDPVIWDFVPFIALLNMEYFLEIRDPLDFEKRLSYVSNFNPCKYHSKGQGSLTIELSSNEVSSRETSSSSFQVTYDNYLLESAKSESKSKRENETREEKFELSFKALGSFSITLPSGWEKTLQRN